MTWALAESVKNDTAYTGTNVAGTNVPLTIAAAAGDLVVVQTTVGANPTGLAVSTVKDNNNNALTRFLAAAGGQLYDGFDNQGFDYWWYIVPTGGTLTYTYTIGTNEAFVAIRVDRYTGSDATTTVRDSKGQAQTNPGNGTDAMTSTSVAAQSGDLQIGANGNGSGLATPVVGTGFTITGAINPTSGMLTEFKTASGAGAATFTDATNGATHTYATFSAAFTPASGGGGSVVEEDPYLRPVVQPIDRRMAVYT